MSLKQFAMTAALGAVLYLIAAPFARKSGFAV